MPIKETTNYDVKAMLQENGIDYADFVSYIKNKSSKSLLNEKKSNTVIHIIDKFIDDLNKNDLLMIKSKNTTKYYLSFLRRFKEYLLLYNKNLFFSDLNEVVFYDFINNINEVSKTKLSQGSINTYITIVKKLCTFAVDNDFISKNINFRFNLISYATLPRYFSSIQIKNIFTETDKIKNPHLWRTIFITLLGTGLRIHELAGLRVKDFDIENKLIFTLGKGNKERYVPIYPGVEEAVIKYLEKTGVQDLTLAKEGYLFSKIFGSNRNKPISVRCIQDNFLKITKKLKYEERFSIHSFRHTFAVNCLKVNMQLIYLCQILGHSSPTSTAVYTQLLPRDLQQVVDEKYPFPLEKLIKELLDEVDN